MPVATPVSGFGDFGSLARQGGGFRTLYNDEAESRPWNVTMPGHVTRNADMLDMVADPIDQIDPIEEAAQEAFLQGFQEGERITREAADADDAARVQLATSVAQIAHAGEGTLAAMMSQAVIRLVSQIMGEVAVDEALLKERCAAVAACIDVDDRRALLEVNPEDMPLLEMEGLGVALSANPALSRGSVRLATADGWVEDGPDVRLARLKALMDDMEGRH
jgi:flagellar assembly protein FliH